MKLNKDGTATLEINGEALTLRNPTWGELKNLRKKAVLIQDQVSTLLEAWGTSLDEELSPEAKELFFGSSKTPMNKKTLDRKAKDLSADDQARVKEATYAIQVEIPETTGELTADWWVNTIATLNGTDIKADDIPGGLARIGSIEQYVVHVENIPFDSGP